MANLPDFMKYKDKFSESGFVEKISRVAKRAGSKLVYAALILYYTLESPKVSLKDKAYIIGALGYLISPLDVVPDAIPNCWSERRFGGARLCATARLGRCFRRCEGKGEE